MSGVGSGVGGCCGEGEVIDYSEVAMKDEKDYWIGAGGLWFVIGHLLIYKEIFSHLASLDAFKPSGSAKAPAPASRRPQRKLTLPSRCVCR